MSTNLSPEPSPTDRKMSRGLLVALVILAALVLLALFGFVLGGS